MTCESFSLIIEKCSGKEGFDKRTRSFLFVGLPLDINKIHRVNLRTVEISVDFDESKKAQCPIWR
jgi:hypothetical protein